MDPQYPQPTRAPAPAGQPHHHPAYEHHPQYAHPRQSHQHDPDLRHACQEKVHDPRRQHDSVISHPFSPKASSPPSPASSVSSSSRRHEHEHATVTQPVAYPAPAHMDPEKAAYGVRDRDANVTTILYDSSVYHEKGPEEKPIQLLLYLSGPCVLLSFAITLYTFFALPLSLALAPIRRQPLATTVTNLLAPALNLQLRLIYSYAASDSYSVPMLITIHLFSPIVSIGVSIAAWTAAFFWFFNAILGDPARSAGQVHGKHNDGKDTLLGVRNWWDRWLSRGLRAE